ncbi:MULTISPECIES: tail fiber assembly protein [Edwardsiella]|nr:caudovirales tail fiber assembly protein [Edwardsiella piscicida]
MGNSPLTHDDPVIQANADRQSLLDESNAVTAGWRSEPALGAISDVDKAKLSAGIEYIKAVKTVDMSTSPLLNGLFLRRCRPGGAIVAARIRTARYFPIQRVPPFPLGALPSINRVLTSRQGAIQLAGRGKCPKL